MGVRRILNYPILLMMLGSLLDSDHVSINCIFETRNSTHCLHTSLNAIRSSKQRGCASWEHCNLCAVVSSALSQTHVVSPV